MRDLLAFELAELEEKVLAWGQPRYRADQLFTWLHGKGVSKIEDMPNLPKDLRAKLVQQFPSFPLDLVKSVRAEDGTEKFQFRLKKGGLIESVLIPEEKRLTLCLSTQLGCAMACLFCRTGKMGCLRNLGTEEILGQYYAIRSLLGARHKITHIVLMGMGEPLENLNNTLRTLRILNHPKGAHFSPRRITVSTVGIPDRIETLFNEIPVSITFSLNAADNKVRDKLMPINRKYPIEEVLATLRQLPLPPRRRFSIAYVLIQGENDGLTDARRLVRLLHGIRCKINLIPFNPFPGTALEAPAKEAVIAFQDLLRTKGMSAHVRFSRGKDVLAACGQLGGEAAEADGLFTKEP